MNFPSIGITLGDPGGVGPEVVLKAIQDKTQLPEARFVLFGVRGLWESFIKEYPLLQSAAAEYEFINIEAHVSQVKMGEAAAENGRISFFSFARAVEMAQRHRIDAIVTAPISKESWNLAGIKWAGHTEYMHSLYPEALMSFFSNNLNVSLFTHHLPLQKALKRIKKEALEDFLFLLFENVQKIWDKPFTFLMAGLNPHAGESGILGSEEIKEIIPAIKGAQARGVPVEGPFPADVVFRMAYGRKDRIVVALYHDQGLIAFKLAAFETGVNVTLGLPFVRTSPDHGTAFDIAGKRKADPRSMIQAIQLAGRFAAGLG